MKAPKTPLVVTLVLIGCALLVGCGTTSRVVELEPVVRIEVGMPAADLVALIGEPSLVRPAEPARDGFEVWVYEFELSEVEMVPTKTVDRPYINPVTGEMLYEAEPVYEAIDRVKLSTLEVLLNDGLVVAWKKQTEVGYDFSES